MKLEGRTVFISGAARRIGKVIALTAVKLGADIVLHYGSSEQAARETAKEIMGFGRKVSLFQYDLSKSEDLKRAFQNVFEETSVQILVNNASIFEPLLMQETSLESWQRHLQINLTAPFLLSQAFAESFKADNGGKIINLLDWRALRPGSDHFPYTVSKSGLAGLTKAMAVSLAPSISVNGLALGAILPPADEGDLEEVIKPIPMQRWAKMEELQETLGFLLTAPDYISGEIIHLDGGRHLV